MIQSHYSTPSFNRVATITERQLLRPVGTHSVPVGCALRTFWGAVFRAPVGGRVGTYLTEPNALGEATLATSRHRAAWIYFARPEMRRFRLRHRNPKRKRGNRLGCSLTLRVSIVSARVQYNHNLIEPNALGEGEKKG